jgi:dihydroorotase
MVRSFPGLLVGVKLAHFRGPDWEPTRRAVAAGGQAEVPVMIDFGGSDPVLPLAQLLLEELRPGDILTHCYANVGSRESVVDSTGALIPGALEAQERGIIFDIGHGGGSFRFDVAMPAIAQGLRPTTISSDLHVGSMNSGMKDMANLLSKCLAMGLSWPEAVAASTWKPAQVIGRDDLGHLSEGAVADVALFRIEAGDYGFVDVRRKRLGGKQRVVAEMTIRGGWVAWDLNGLAATPWDAAE